MILHYRDRLHATDTPNAFPLWLIPRSHSVMATCLRLRSRARISERDNNRSESDAWLTDLDFRELIKR